MYLQVIINIFTFNLFLQFISIYIFYGYSENHTAIQEAL
jgi:hypothetical protein